MPAVSTIKTYGRVKKYKPKTNAYKHSNVSVTEASIVFDALFAENIRKRNLSQVNQRKGNRSEHKNTRKRKIDILDHPKPECIFLDDTINVKINSTFDDLKCGPIYNSVKFTDTAKAGFSDSSYEKSSVQTSGDSSIKTCITTRSTRQKRNTHVNNICNENKVIEGKVKKRKNDIKSKMITSVISTIERSSKGIARKRNLRNRQGATNTNCNVCEVKVTRKISNKHSRKNSNNNPHSPPHVNKHLQEPVECSIILEKIDNKNHQSLELSKLLIEENMQSKKQLTKLNVSLCKLTPIISTSQEKCGNIISHGTEYESMFSNSFKHCMRAESTPKYICTSTPKVPRITLKRFNEPQLEYMSPISSSKNIPKSHYNSSLFVSRMKNPFESFNNLSYSNIEICHETQKRDVTNNIIITINDTEPDNLSIPNDSKLNIQPVVVIDNILEVLGISANFNVDIKKNVNGETITVTAIPCSDIIENTLQASRRYGNKQKKNVFAKRGSVEKKITIESKEQLNNSLNFSRSKDVLTSNHDESVILIESSINTFEPPNFVATRKKTRPNSPIRTLEVNLQDWEEFSSNCSHIFLAENSKMSYKNQDNKPAEVCILKQQCNENPIDTPHKFPCIKSSQILLQKIDIEPEQLRIAEKEIVQNSNISKVLEMPIIITNKENLFLTPGKQWRRSLSILKTHNSEIFSSTGHKGRKWRSSIFRLLDQQHKSTGALNTCTIQPKGNILTKNVEVLARKSVRKSSIRVVKLTKIVTNRSKSTKSGYVSTIADDTVLENFTKLSLDTVDQEREKTAKEIILKRCEQTAPLLFDDCYSQRTLKKCRKIGEGVYGEVFMYKTAENKCVVMKIIPIEGEQLVNGEHQKKFEEIISEIIISTELSNLRTNSKFKSDGFVEVLNVCLVQGKYPQHLIDLWDLYDEDRGSENDSPQLFNDDQLYIVLELANGGQDLEAYHFSSAEQSYSLFNQIICSMAVAEAALQFEHRDLHWGNVLITATDEPTISFFLNGREFEIPTKGVKLTIIDFTLSRMTYNDCCIFNDLAMDPDLFTAKGDYQFDIYRLMRKRNLDEWQNFEPYSNILWLDYTLDKMINQLRYIRTNSKTHKTHIRKLTQLRKKILSYNSVMEFINSDVFLNVFL